MPVQFAADVITAERDGERFRPDDARPGIAQPKSEMIVEWGAFRMSVLLKVFLFLEGCTHNGLTHLVNVYLVAIDGWTPLDASWIWFTRDAMMFLLQAYAGSFVDRTTWKKSILAAVGILKIIAGIIMVTTTSMAPQILKGAIDGIINAFVIPATTALTLGAVGKTKFHKKHAQLNIMVKNLGVSLSAIILGAVAWAIYPDIQHVFYQFVAVGVLCLVCVLVMPSKDVVDHRVARGQSIRAGQQHWTQMSGIKSLLLMEEDESESEGEGEEVNESPASASNEEEEGKTEEENTGEGMEHLKIKGGAKEEGRESTKTNEELTEYSNVLSIRQMFNEPTRRKSLIFLCLTFFSYHLVNATILPLLGQYIGTRENARNILPSMTGLIVMKELGSFFTNWFIKSRLQKSMYKPILFTGCCVLLLRLILISILVNYTDNLWALGSTNILEGVGIGCLDLVLTLYSHLLSRQTGHYNLNMGIVSTFKTLGSALSVVIGGALATKADYNAAFPVLTVMVVFPLTFSIFVHTPNLHGKV